MLIDSHAHIDYDYEFSTEELLARAANAGVSQIIAIAAAADSLERVSALSEKFPNVFFTSGIHPHDAKDFTPEIFSKIQTLARRNRCVAIGELGLDFYYENSSQELQFSALEAQLNFSVEIGKPVVIHTRDAEDDTLRFLRSHASAFQSKYPNFIPGVIHCFTGSARLAEACLDLGYYLSFSGIITFKNAESLRDIVKTTPLDRLLVETDSPFLAPVPHRGKKNEPAHTRVVAEKIAEIKNLPFMEIANLTRANTERLFRLPSTPNPT